MSGSETFAEGLVGVVLDGRYRLDAVLGEGGMGAVFRANQLAMDRKVAVKLLKPHLTQDEVALQRFVREARATLRVDSPHAVKVLDFGITPHRDYYMVLEYLDGRTVQRELDVDGPFAPARVLHIAKQMARALGAAHGSGLVHRDIKPDNVLLMRVGDDADYTKVLDFGVAKLMEGAARSSRSQLSLTQAGMVFGTPEFMSPEQACGQVLDGRSDLYSLAATMFAMLTGRGMYAASTAIEWLTAHAITPPPHLADGLPELAPLVELDQLVQACLAKRPGDRPKSAEELIDRIERIERGERPIEVTSEPKVGGPIRTVFSPSAFVAALPRADTEPATPEPPIEPAVEPPARRGLVLAVGGIAIAAIVVVAIALAATHSSHREPPSPPPVIASAPALAPAPPPTPMPVPTDAAIAPDAAIAALAPALPTPPPPPTTTTHATAPKPPPHTSDVDSLLAEAEAAKRAGNTIRWIAKADLAQRHDPKNARALLLLADGLIAGGDPDHACNYLRMLPRAQVVAQLAQAHCSRD